MSLDDIAIDAIERASKGLDRDRKPNLYRALMRLAGNALAAMQGNEEAAAEHTRLGHQHFTRGPRR